MEHRAVWARRWGHQGHCVHCFVLSNPLRVGRRDVPMHQGRGNSGAPASLCLSLAIDTFCPWFKAIKCSEILLIPWLLSQAAGLQWHSWTDVCKEGCFVWVRIGLLLQNALLPYLPKDLATPRRNHAGRNTPVSRAGRHPLHSHFLLPAVQRDLGAAVPQISKPMKCTAFCPLPRADTVTNQGK